MKSLLVLSICTIISLSCSNKNMIYAEGPLLIEVRNVACFKRVDVQDGLVVKLFKSSSHCATIETQANVAPYIETEVQDSTLIIKIKKNTYISGDCLINIAVDVNFLDKVSASSGGYIIFDCEAFALQTLDVNCTRGGKVELSGCIDVLNVNASQGSHIGSFDVSCNQYLNLTLSDGSTAQMYMNGICDASLFTGSIFKYRGDGVVRSSNITAGSQIIKEDF